jgi:hypothetical protein
MNATVVALLLIALPLWVAMIAWLIRTDPGRRPKQASRDRNGDG